MDDTVIKLPVVRWMLHVLPVIYAARTAATAIWAGPTGPYPFQTDAWFQAQYWGATIGYLAWAAVAHRHLRMSVYLGVSLSLLCMYRAVTLIEERSTVGPVAWSTVVNWATFSVSTLLSVALSAQYILVSQGREREL